MIVQHIPPVFPRSSPSGSINRCNCVKEAQTGDYVEKRPCPHRTRRSAYACEKARRHAQSGALLRRKGQRAPSVRRRPFQFSRSSLRPGTPSASSSPEWEATAPGCCPCAGREREQSARTRPPRSSTVCQRSRSKSAPLKSGCRWTVSPRRLSTR